MDPIRLESTVDLISNSSGRASFQARIVRAGRITAADGSPGSIFIPSVALTAAAADEKFEGLAVFADHPGLFESAQVKHLVGVTHDSYYDVYSKSIFATIRFYDDQESDADVGLANTIAGILRMMLDDVAAGLPSPDVGLSIVFWPEWEEGSADPRVIRRFRKIDSADIVFSPAADGRILEALSAYALEREVPMSEQTESISRTEVVQPPGIENHLCPPEPEIQVDEWAKAAQATAVPAILAGSGLPEVSKIRLMQSQWRSPADLNKAIEDEQEYLASLVQENIVQMPGGHPRGAGQISMRTSLDRLRLAAEAMFAGEKPGDGIQPLTGVRELYLLLSGDYEITGVFQPERVMFANVTSSTMAGLVANALNKRVVNLFAQYPQWWIPIVFEEDFTTLQDVRWITLGGVGELPTVAEGAAYTELTWDDMTETDSFVKKGGYLGITLEAIDKDDTRRITAAPRALAQGAWLTLAKSVSAIFTDNSGTGPTMSDSVALFHANHSNLGSTALSFAAWEATRTAMRKQTELNSSERLGALSAPKYLLVPPDLETAALQVLGSALEPAVANNDINPFAEGVARDALLESARRRVIVVDLWTDTDNWAAISDPNLYPSIGIGYRFGRNPEIYSVASPTAGLMFSNDTLPVKVRFFFAVGPVDWRGMYKHNV
jgi:hypothetical protein